MIAFVSDNPRTVLLILRNDRGMYPLNTEALTRGQASRKHLVDDYLGAVLLDVDGTIREIQRVEVLGAFGDSIGRRILSRLTDAWNVRVDLSEPLCQPLAETKRLVVDALRLPQTLDTFAFDERRHEQVLADIQAASSAADLIKALHLPPPDQALDVL